MSTLFEGNEVVVENSLQFGEPKLRKRYQWMRRMGMPAKITETITYIANLTLFYFTVLIEWSTDSP